MSDRPQPRALVTGAAVRLGRAIALELGDMGFDVAVHYGRSQAEAEEVVAALDAKGRRAVALQADLSDEDAVAGLIPAAQHALGGALTCLVNNASVFEEDSFRTATRASWDKHMETNLRAPFHLLQAFAAQCPPPQSDAQGEAVAQGVAINMIDQRVFKLTPNYTSYTLSRAALWALTQTAAQGLAPAVRVNAIGPGPTLQNVAQTDVQFDKERKSTILTRGAAPSDIAEAVRYLVSARSVTGQMICVDGGQHLAWQTPDVTGVECP